MKSCKFEKLACLYQNNMLSSKEIIEFERHLSNCAKCKEIIESEKEIKTIYTRYEKFIPPIDLEERIFNYILTKKEQVGNSIDSFVTNFVRRLIPAVIGLAVSLLFIVLFTSQKTADDYEKIRTTSYLYTSANLTEEEKDLLFSNNSSTENFYYMFIKSM